MASNDRIERGLQSVPRGLPSGLGSYLQSLDAVVRRLAGMARNSKGSEAVRMDQASLLGNKEIPENSITSDKISKGAVTSDKIAKYAINSEKIADRSVTGNKLARSTITSREIQEKSIGESKLADDGVSSSKLKDSSVTNGKINNEAVTTEKIADNSVTEGKLSQDVIDKISVETVSISGTSNDGEAISLGKDWLSTPGVFVTDFSLDIAEKDGDNAVKLMVGIDGIQFSEDAGWTATASCRSISGQNVSQGTLSWGAVGRIRKKNE